MFDESKEFQKHGENLKFFAFVSSKLLNIFLWCQEIQLCVRNGLIYFPDFCQVVLKRYRQDKDAEEYFMQNMFKVKNVPITLLMPL